MTDTQEALDTLGQRLVWARKMAGLKIGQACKLLSIDRQTLLAWESDACALHFKDKVALSQVYDVRLNWLIEGIEVAPGPMILDAAPGGATPVDIERVRELVSRVRQHRRHW